MFHRPVNITFPPLVVPELPELEALYQDLEARRQQDLHDSRDPEQTVRLARPLVSADHVVQPVLEPAAVVVLEEEPATEGRVCRDVVGRTVGLDP